jgi:hypothetical protein
MVQLFDFEIIYSIELTEILLVVMCTFVIFTNGLEVIVEILESSIAEEDEQREAVGVIAQLTSPWVEANLCKDKIGKHLVGIIHSLKGKVVNQKKYLHK